MFWSSPSADIQIIIFLLSISLLIAAATYFFSKKILVSIFVMSLLSNVILYLGIDYNFSKIYNVPQLFQFTRDIFPYINLALFILLVISFIKTKYAK
jgi:hypothetical protein